MAVKGGAEAGNKPEPTEAKSLGLVRKPVLRTECDKHFCTMELSPCPLQPPEVTLYMREPQCQLMPVESQRLDASSLENNFQKERKLTLFNRHIPWCQAQCQYVTFENQLDSSIAFVLIDKFLVSGVIVMRNISKMLKIKAISKTPFLSPNQTLLAFI